MPTWRRLSLPGAARAQTLVDVSLAVFLFAIGVGWPGGVTGAGLGLPVGVALVAGQSLPLAIRRKAPRAVFVVVAAASIFYGVYGFAGSPIDLGEPVALYTVATAHQLADSAGALGISVVGLIVEAQLNARWGGPTQTLAVVLVFTLVTAVGRHQRLRAVRLSEAIAHGSELERRHAEHAALVAAEERLRLAEELHDVVGHGLTVVLLQAGLARRTLDAEPDRARAAVEVIEERARSAMQEMQTLLAVLRDDSASRAPIPTIADIDRLRLDVAGAGISVALELHGTVRALPELIESSAFRIVQEALTNVVRHSRADTAMVRVGYGDHALEIDVADNGIGMVESPPSCGGRGLIGMRERVTRLGGTLALEQVESGGFRVLARIPVAQPGDPAQRVLMQ